MLAIDRAPIVIGLTWALIIAGAMRITDALGVRRRYAPVVDSVLAIMLDLAFDAVAIRMGLWTWRDVGLEDGWFGVPFGNFYSWLFVTLAFSLLTRWLRDAAQGRPALEWLQLLVPIPAFVILIASIVPFAAVLPLVDPSPGGGRVLFAADLRRLPGRRGLGRLRPGPRPAEWRVVRDPRPAARVRDARRDPPLLPRGARRGSAWRRTEPMILAVALVLLAAEVPLAWLTERRHTAATGAGRPRLERRRRGGLIASALPSASCWIGSLRSRASRVVSAVDPALWLLAAIGFISQVGISVMLPLLPAVRDGARRPAVRARAC